MENFEGQLKKYRKTINALEQKNAALSEKAAASRENSVKPRLEIVLIFAKKEEKGEETKRDKWDKVK